MTSSKKSIFSLTLSDLESYLVLKGYPKFSAKQAFNWIYRRYEFDISKWSNVSNKAKQSILEDFDFDLPTIVWNIQSEDKTRKFLFEMKDKNKVETVLIYANKRITICISSQVGCAIGCKFCHTGTMGLKRHLTAGEIVGQFIAASKWNMENTEGEKITNIVYMGQGEPLHNFENCKAATEIFLEPNGLALGQRRITLSTSGLVPQIELLGQFPPVNIAISLHSAKDKVRSELMPINKTYDLSRLFKAIKEIPLKAHRYITYEYLLIDGLNNTDSDVEAISKRIPKSVSKINLIPFNEYPGSNFKRPSNEKNMWFMDKLIKAGYVTTIRKTKGQDVLAACGQLKSFAEDKAKLNLWEN